MKENLKCFALCFSLANLCFINNWGDLFSRGYGLVGSSYTLNLTVTMTTVLLFSALFFELHKWCLDSKRRFWRFVAYMLFLKAFLIIPHEIKLLLKEHQLNVFPKIYWKSLGYGLILLFTFLYYQYPALLRNSISHVLMIFFPFGLLMFGYAAKALIFPTQPLAPIHPNPSSGPRVVWMVFDEMDFHLAFSHRQEGIALPELDRLRKESFFATSSFQAASHTMLALPSLILGQKILYAQPKDAKKLRLTFPNNKKGDWDKLENIFSRAYQKKKNTALVGWYHPYERILSNDLTYCYNSSRSEGSFCQLLGKQMEKFLETNFHWFYRQLRKNFHNRFERKWEKKRVLTYQVHIDSYLEIYQHAEQLATDPNYQLALIHWPIPHAPGIYDAKKDCLSTKPCSYWENLLLVDNTLKKLRLKMKKAGVWDQTCLIITSDHWLRKELLEKDEMNFISHETLDQINRIGPLVPFLVKFPKQKEGIIFEEPFNSLVLHDLILQILDEKITKPDEIATWLNDNRLLAP